MAVDWGALVPRLRAGDQTCSTHGVITPVWVGQLPTCGDCGELAGRVLADGQPVVQEPAPAHCEGPARHPFGPDLVEVKWTGCECPARGHRTWWCCRCDSVLRWPPCG